MQSKRKQFLTGARWGIPIVLGFIPVGIAYAIMARQAGFSIPETVSMSVAVFAGASQMMAVGMYTQGASIIAMIFATFIINLRHVIMGTCIINRIRNEKRGTKIASFFGITDESFAIFTTAPQEKCSVWSLLGMGIVTYLSWVAGSAIGAVASDLLPEIITASLGISLYAMFIGLLVPGLAKNLKLTLLIAFTAVCNSVLSIWLPSSWSLIISTLVCAGIGVFFVDLGGEKNEN